jgi:hypothetical protein
MTTFAVLLAACATSEPPKPAPPDRAPPAERAPAPAGASLELSGTIAYDGPAKGAAVFVAVKDPSQPGPPLAAKKLPPGPFPLTFSLTDADRMPMGGGRALPEKVTLLVRLDADGDAMTKDPSEPSATQELPARSADLAITLSVPQ